LYVAEECSPRGSHGGAGHVHEGGGLPEGDVVVEAGVGAREQAVGVWAGFGEGGVGEVEGEGAEEDVACAV